MTERQWYSLGAYPDHARETDTRHAADPEPRPRIGDPRGRASADPMPLKDHRSHRDRSQQRVPSGQHTVNDGSWPIRRAATPTCSDPPPGCRGATERCPGHVLSSVLRDLTTKLGETSHFAYARGRQVFFVDHHIPTGQVISVAGQTGEFAPLHCTRTARRCSPTSTARRSGACLGGAAARLHAQHDHLADDAWPRVRARSRRGVRARRCRVSKTCAASRRRSAIAGRDRAPRRDLLARARLHTKRIRMPQPSSPRRSRSANPSQRREASLADVTTSAPRSRARPSPQRCSSENSCRCADGARPRIARGGARRRSRHARSVDGHRARRQVLRLWHGRWPADFRFRRRMDHGGVPVR